MEYGLHNITDTNVATLIPIHGSGGAIKSISIANQHDTVASHVDLYLDDGTNTSYIVKSAVIPSGTALGLALLLVPIEVISYIFKPIALATRLFANMMAGHILLKVIVGFAYTLMGASGILFLFHYMPLIILIPLFGLELGVAIIQSFVFAILICIYLNDSINLH